MRVLVIWETWASWVEATRLAVILREASGLKWDLSLESFGPPDGNSLVELLRAHNIAARVAAGEIDEVWIESSEQRQLPEWELHPTERFAFIGIHEGLGTILEHFAHRVEHQMQLFYGSWDAGYLIWGNKPKIVHDWDRFTATEAHFPWQGKAGVGNAHGGPGARGTGWNYDWGDEDPGAQEGVLSAHMCPGPVPPAPSNHLAWGDYPNLDLSKIECVDRETWGRGRFSNTYKEGGLTWWLHHIPKNPGEHLDGGAQKTVPNDWWQIITFGRASRD